MENSYHKKYFNSISNGLNKTDFYLMSKKISGDVFFDSINKKLNEIKKKKGRLFFFGNGASSAFANHMALDFSKNGKISSFSLSDSAYYSALSNDFSFDNAITEYLKLQDLNNKDAVITISASGNSSNIVNTLNYCKKSKILSISLSGLKNDNKSIALSNFSIYVPMKTYGIVECIHQIILHLILDNFMGICEWERDYYQNMDSNNFKI